jgi:hypothetical protein
MYFLSESALPKFTYSTTEQDWPALILARRETLDPQSMAPIIEIDDPRRKVSAIDTPLPNRDIVLTLIDEVKLTKSKIVILLPTLA